MTQEDDQNWYDLYSSSVHYIVGNTCNETKRLLKDHAVSTLPVSQQLCNSFLWFFNYKTDNVRKQISGASAFTASLLHLGLLVLLSLFSHILILRIWKGRYLAWNLPRACLILFPQAYLNLASMFWALLSSYKWLIADWGFSSSI